MTSKIYIAGHTGLVGASLVRHFSKKENVQLVLASRSELDLTCQQLVENFLEQTRPDTVIVAAGRVGGIQANACHPAQFIYENLMIEGNVIHASWKSGVKRLLNFGSSCVYPKNCRQPMTPDLLMTGKIETTNEPYAIAKLAGMSLCSSYNKQYGTSYINVIPSNVYGPGDNFDLESCHVISALICKFHEAKLQKKSKVVLMGSGQVTRDFLFVDDLVLACEAVLKEYDGREIINIGAQAPCTIRQLSSTIGEVVGFSGDIVWDTTKPDGAPERILDASAIQKIGWMAQTCLKEGLQKTYQWFLNNIAKEEKKQCVS